MAHIEKLSAENVEAAVLSAIDRLREVLPSNSQLDRSRAALLLGDGTSLDSMAVVNLLVFIEEEMLRALRIEITLAGLNSEDVIEPEAFETVGSLIDAICEQVGLVTPA